ncbi:MAG: hypothetical protein Q8R06_08635 [Polaromonas sp.]|nr:hypothetical protein [Polaromonas sp.]MDP3797203.1 hypothetical protein [Polaromonas sp.]
MISTSIFQSLSGLRALTGGAAPARSRGMALAMTPLNQSGVTR